MSGKEEGQCLITHLFEAHLRRVFFIHCGKEHGDQVAVIMALIIYTLTLEKLHPIALLKLIGAPNHTIIGLILQQSLIMGALAYGIGYVIGQRLFPLFPRRVLVTGDDLLRLAGIVLLISVAGSLLGIWKAMRVAPNEAIG